jgi:hypothetical protein
MAAVLMSAEQQARRRRVRHSTLLWSAVALAFYLGFIVLILVRAAR